MDDLNSVLFTHLLTSWLISYVGISMFPSRNSYYVGTGRWNWLTWFVISFLTAQRLVQYDVLPAHWSVLPANELLITKDPYLK